MRTVDEIKSIALAEIDRRGDELIGIAKTILEHPGAGIQGIQDG